MVFCGGSVVQWVSVVLWGTVWFCGGNMVGGEQYIVALWGNVVMCGSVEYNVVWCGSVGYSVLQRGSV